MSAVAEIIPTEMPSPIVFTDSAAAKVADLIAEEGNPELKLRVFVQGGGCSGFQYGFTFDEITNEDDTTMTKNGVSLLIARHGVQPGDGFAKLKRPQCHGGTKAQHHGQGQPANGPGQGAADGHAGGADGQPTAKQAKAHRLNGQAREGAPQKRKERTINEKTARRRFFSVKHSQGALCSGCCPGQHPAGPKA